MSENKFDMGSMHIICSWHENRAKEKPMGNDIGDKSNNSSLSSKKSQVEREKIP